MNILNKRPIEATTDCIIEAIGNLLAGEVPLTDLQVIKGFGSHYEKDNYSMKVFAENLRKWGVIVNAGDRLEYVVVNTVIPDLPKVSEKEMIVKATAVESR